MLRRFLSLNNNIISCRTAFTLRYVTSPSKDGNDEEFIPDFSQGGEGNNSRGGKNVSRSVGKITKWVDDKGFGFVSLQGKSLFVHAREIVKPRSSSSSQQSSSTSSGNPKLTVGQTVEFTVGAQPDGRLKAMKVSEVGGKPVGTKTTAATSSSDSNKKTNKDDEDNDDDDLFSADAFDLGEDSSDDSSKTVTGNNNGNKKKVVGSQQSEGKSKFKNKNSTPSTRDKLFSSYQWNCVESGNPSVEGFKVTQFPTNPQGNHEIPVPSEKWTDEDKKNKEKKQASNSSASNSNSYMNIEVEEAKIKASLPPPPSSNSRPIWESELLGWPTEFSAREMDFFDLEELEEKRSGWTQQQH